MTLQLQEPSRVNEPRLANEYADVMSRVAAERQTVIVRRDGIDLAAIIPLEYLELLNDALAMEETQRHLKLIDLPRLSAQNPPPQNWFDGDEPKPF